MFCFALGAAIAMFQEFRGRRDLRSRDLAGAAVHQKKVDMSRFSGISRALGSRHTTLDFSGRGGETRSLTDAGFIAKELYERCRDAERKWARGGSSFRMLAEEDSLDDRSHAPGQVHDVGHSTCVDIDT
jgi:hypothetical protein